MNKTNILLFDLDGTLINSIDMIVRCFDNSLNHAAGLFLTPEVIRRNVGLPLREQFLHYLPDASEEELASIMKYHMDFQKSIWREHLHLYDGVIELLKNLSDNGRRMAVVTSRRIETAQLYTEGLGIRQYFEFLITPESTAKHKPHPQPALEALRLMSASADNAMMIGDSNFDIECGSRAGTKTCFVTWGAGERPAAPYLADYEITSPLELLDLLKNEVN